MPTQPVPILSPAKGVVRAVAREGQPPDTCWDAQNVLPYDRYGRKRLSQRGGLVLQDISVDGQTIDPTGVTPDSIVGLNASFTKMQAMIECPVVSYPQDPVDLGTLTELEGGWPAGSGFVVTSTGSVVSPVVNGSVGSPAYTFAYPTESLALTYDWKFQVSAILTQTNAGIGHCNSTGTGSAPNAGTIPGVPGGFPAVNGDAKFVVYFPYNGSTSLIVVLAAGFTSSSNIDGGIAVMADCWQGDVGSAASTWTHVSPHAGSGIPVYFTRQTTVSGTLYAVNLACDLQILPVTGQFVLTVNGASANPVFKGTMTVTQSLFPVLGIQEVDTPGMDMSVLTGGGRGTFTWVLIDNGTAMTAIPNATSTIAANSPLVVANHGLVYYGDPAGNFITADGQSSALLNLHTQVSMAFLSGGSIGPAVYMVDGNHFVYLSLVADEGGKLIVQQMLPAMGSTLPTNCGLCCNWRGRLVLAGDSNNPQNFYMSRSGNPQDWDFSQLDPAAAVAGNLSKSGLIGEPIMALMPFSDDYMMIGCLNSLWMLQGDPADGGTIVNVSNSMGFTSPNAWCVSPDGTMYFIARGGLYSVRPAWEFYRPPELLSGQTYDQYFNQIINGQFYVSMVWDVDTKYMHIFATPINAELDGVHLIFDSRNGGLWPQVYPHNFSPTCTCKYLANSTNGKPAVLLGGFDSNIRAWSPTALNDGLSPTHPTGEPINAYAVLGPIKAGPEASILSGVTIDMGETLVTDDAGDWNATATLKVGPDAYSVTEGTPHSSAVIPIPLDRRQKTFRQRFRGGWFSLTLANSIGNTYFSFESAVLEFIQAGRNRERR